MAGFYSKNNGFVYDGEATSVGPIRSGQFCSKIGDANVGLVAIDDGGTPGVFTVQITTAFIADEVITFEGVNYTAKAVEDVEKKEFAIGVSSANQVTSLVKMMTSSTYTIVADGDKIKFTQKVPNAADAGPAVTKTSVTGVLGAVAQVTAPADALLIADIGYRFRIVEITTFLGAPALRMDVVTVGAVPVFMVEPVFPDNNFRFNANSLIDPGTMLRMRRPQAGDQIVVNIPAVGGLAVGTMMEITNGTGGLNAA